MKCWIALFAVIVSMQCIHVRAQKTKIYVGNLSFTTTDARLKAAFQKYGKVDDAIVMLDRETGKSRGFGYITMASPQAANNAIKGLDSATLDGRVIKVRPN